MTKISILNVMLVDLVMWEFNRKNVQGESEGNSHP